MRTSSALGLLVLLALAPSACREAGRTTATGDGQPRGSAGAGVRLVDAAGRTVHLAAPARRVVSLVPSATETLHLLGLDSVVAGRTRFDTASWAAAIPSVGGGLHPDLERIVALRPDLVIHFAGTQDPDTPARLDDLGIPRVAVRPERVDDVLAAVRLVGLAVGAGDAADALASRLRAGLDSVRGGAAGLAPVPAAFLLPGDPPWAAGGGTYVGELITLAGGENVFADLSAPWSPVSVEVLLQRRPSVVLATSPRALRAAADLGLRARRLPPSVELPGPGVVDAARAILAALHPPHGP